MKNRCILLCIKALKRWTKSSPATAGRKILVVSTTALGDTLWATPALESLSKSFPEATIAVLTSPIGEQVLRNNPWVNKIFVLHEPLLPRFFGLWRKLKREQFQEIVIFHASQRLALPLCSLLGARKIVGTSGINKGLDALLTDPVPPSEEHEIVRRLGLIEKLGATRCTEQLSFFLTPTEEVSKHSGKTVAIHPGSKDSFKRWPAEHFIRAGQKLAQLGAKVTITGSKEEAELMEQIAHKIPGATCSDTTLSLRGFAAQLKPFDLLISNDTGPVHLACALDVPVIALYSPTNPLLCGPHKAKKALAIAQPPTCDPCLKRKCRRPFCLLQIGPEEVVTHATKMLSLY